MMLFTSPMPQGMMQWNTGGVTIGVIMMRSILVAAMILVMTGCATQTVGQRDNHYPETWLVQQYYVPESSISDMAAEYTEALHNLDGVSFGPPTPTRLAFRSTPYRCGFFLHHPPDVPEADWRLTGWQEYQVYNAIQHIHHNADPTQRRVLITLSVTN